MVFRHRRRRRGGQAAVRLLIASVLALGMGRAEAQDGSGAGTPPMVEYMNDAGCAAAAESWLIGMPNGTPTAQQIQALDVLGFFVLHARAAAQAAGRPADNGFAATQAFVADLLPHLKSSDPAEAEKARAQAADGTRRCAARPDFQNRTRGTKP